MEIIEKVITDQLEEDFSIDPAITSKMWREGLINETTARRYIFRREFQEKKRKKMISRVRGMIAMKYGVSLSLVEYHTKDL